jgi:hypothetical protein
MPVTYKESAQKRVLARATEEQIKENVKVGGEHGNQYKKEPKSNVLTLANLGVTRNESSRLQKIASIPESKFEQILQKAVYQ